MQEISSSSTDSSSSDSSNEKIDEKSKLGERLKESKRLVTEVSAILNEQENCNIPVNSENMRELVSRLRSKFPNLSDDELEQKIATMLTYRARSANTLTNTCKYNTKQGLIAKISGGLALRGIYLGMGSQMLGQCPERALLCSPDHKDPMLEAVDTYKETVFQYSGAEIGKQFIKQVKNSGMKLAIAASFNSFGTIVDASGESQETEYCKYEMTQQTQVRDAGAIYCLYIPKAAFQIRREDMILAPEVVASAKSIKDPNSAIKFLRSYGSHVSTGLYHTGGVFFSSIHLESSELVSELRLRKVALEQLNGRIKAGYSGSAFSVATEVSYDDSDEEASTFHNQKRKKSANSFMEVNVIGPSTSNPEQFKQLLENNENWQIIDRGYAGQAIGVWDLLLDKGLVATAEFIRNTWLNIAKEYPDDIIWQIENTRRFFKFAKFRAAISETIKPANEFKSLSDSSLLEILRKAYSTALENRNHEYIVELFRMNSFRYILVRLFQSSLYPQSQQFISNILDANTQKRLEDNKVKLDLSIVQYLSKETPVQRTKSMEVNYSWESIPKLLSGYRKQSNSTEKASYAIRRAIENKPEHLFPPRNLREILEIYFYDFKTYRFRNLISPEQLISLADDILNSLKNTEQYVHQGANLINVRKFLEERLSFSVIQRTSQLNSKSLCSVDFTVDGKLDGNDRERMFIEKLRGRLEISVKKPNLVNKRSSSRRTQPISINPKPGESSSLETVLNVLSRCTLSGQMELFRILTAQRYSIPLIVTKTFSSSESFTFYYIEAIRHIQAILPGGKRTFIGYDTDLPRIAFVSELSYKLNAEMCQEVCQCTIFSKAALKTGSYSTVVELAIGFIPFTKDEETAQFPCIVLYVYGDYLNAINFLKKVSDVVIVAVEEKDSASFNDLRQRIGDRVSDIWQWKSSTSELEIIDDFMMGNSQKEISGEFQNWIYDLAENEWRERKRVPIIDIETEFIRDEVDFSVISNILEKYDFSSLRSYFVLQDNFKQIVKRQYKLYSVEDQIERNQIETEIENLRQKYSSTAKYITVPILQLFCEILKIEDRDARILALSHFQNKIDWNSQCSLRTLLSQKDTMFNEYEKLKHDNANEDEIGSKLKAYRSLQQQCVSTVVQLEHLWRELSHIYAADKVKNKWIACLAAQHLLDGFPLELVDGDAGLMNAKWVNAVFRQLENILEKQLGKEPSIYTQATLGVQSSGKSTFCNTAYGTRMRTSVGQCTRGIYASVVKARRRPYDFLIQFDTEGLCSPETYGLPGEEARDNRLAFYAILSSDSCVLITNGEDTNTLSNVIPVVMLAFNSSMLAKENGGQNASALSLIYTRVDLSETQKLKTNTQKFLTDIDNASKELIARKDIKHCKHLNLSPEKDSMYHLGFLNEGSEPPKDKPNFDYGKRVSNFREEIVSKALQKSRKPKSFISQAEYLELVTNCILSNNFELNFASFIEYDSYQKFRVACTKINLSVAAKYAKEYEILEKKLPTSKENAEELFLELKGNVEEAINESKLQLDEELKNARLRKWKTEALSGFEIFLQGQSVHYSNLIKNAIEMRDGVDAKVKYYVTQLRKKIRERFVSMREGKSTHCSDWDSWVQAYDVSMSSVAKGEKQRKLMRCFVMIFKSEILDKVEAEYPPTANTVPSAISKLYTKNVDHFVNANQSINKSLIKSFFTSMKSFFSESKEAEFCKLVREIEQEMLEKTLSVNRYRGDIVLSTIRSTREKFLRMHEEDALRAHCLCHDRLIEILQEKQEKWDEKNNLFKILQGKEGELGGYFIGIALGYSMEQVLTDDILNILKSNMHSAFHKHVMSRQYARIVSDISSSKYDWIVDFAKLNAHVSRDIVQKIKEEKKASNLDQKKDIIEQIIKIVADRANHHNKVISDLLICQLTDGYLGECWTEFKAVVTKMLDSPSLQGGNVESLIKLLSGEASTLPSSLALAFGTLKSEAYQSNEVNSSEMVKKIQKFADEAMRHKEHWTEFKAIITEALNSPSLQDGIVENLIKLLSGKASTFPSSLALAFNTLKSEAYQSDEINLQEVVKNIRKFVEEVIRHKEHWIGFKVIITEALNSPSLQDGIVENLIKLLSGKASTLPSSLALAFDTLKLEARLNNEINSREMVKKIQKFVNEAVKKVDEAEKAEIIKLLIEKLRCRDLDTSVNLRCNILCPRCGASCTQSIGHITKHTADHTPSGLYGGYYRGSNRLMEFSCVIAAKMNHHMYLHHDSDKTESYRKFESVYPRWKLPNWKVSTPETINIGVKVSQYIFKNYQEQLAEYYDRKSSETMPTEYNHTLSDLDDEIGELIGAQL